MKLEGTEEEIKHYKNRALMLKMLCLEEMGHSPLIDVSTLNKRLRVKLQVEIEKRWDDTDILEKFNLMCIETIFDKMDVEELGRGLQPSYDLSEEKGHNGSNEIIL